MRERLAGIVKAGVSARPGSPVEGIAPELGRRLASLGYVGSAQGRERPEPGGLRDPTECLGAVDRDIRIINARPATSQSGTATRRKGARPV
jgi:hypothetical protein